MERSFRSEQKLHAGYLRGEIDHRELRSGLKLLEPFTGIDLRSTAQQLKRKQS